MLILAQQLLEKLLNAERYSQSKLTTLFWTHKWRPVRFTLCVDDFGVKYVGKEHAEHLMSVLKNSYKISADWKGERYLVLDIDWDYEKQELHLSILSYITDALRRFNHVTPRKPQDQP